MQQWQLQSTTDQPLSVTYGLLLQRAMQADIRRWMDAQKI
jgi:hypothetical protein